MTTRPRSKRRAPNRKNQGLCRTNRRAWGRGSRRVLRDREHREVVILKYYIYFSRARYRGCARCPLFPDLLYGHGFTSEHLAFVAGLQLVGCLQKETDVGRVLPVGDAGLGKGRPRESCGAEDL